MTDENGAAGPRIASEDAKHLQTLNDFGEAQRILRAMTELSQMIDGRCQGSEIPDIGWVWALKENLEQIEGYFLVEDFHRITLVGTSGALIEMGDAISRIGHILNLIHCMMRVESDLEAEIAFNFLRVQLACKTINEMVVWLYTLIDMSRTSYCLRQGIPIDDDGNPEVENVETASE